MIFHPYSALYQFRARWNLSPDTPVTIYSTFFNRPPTTSSSLHPFYPHLAGLVALGGVHMEGMQGQYWLLPIGVAFNNTLWDSRFPLRTPGVVPSGSLRGDFCFGNIAEYTVTVDFLAKGGMETWKLSGEGRGRFTKERTSYQGEREIRNLWDVVEELGLPDMGFPQLLYRQVYSFFAEGNLAEPPSLLAYLEREGGKEVLFQYPDLKIKPSPLSALLFSDVVLTSSATEWVDRFGSIYNEGGKGRQLLGHNFTETVLFNFFYRALDFFGPYAIAIPKGEGVWTATISKSLKSAKHFPYYVPTQRKWLYSLVSLPVWEYKVKWYYIDAPIRETPFPKQSDTSFLLFSAPYQGKGEVAIYTYEADYEKLIGKSAPGENPQITSGIFHLGGRKEVYQAGEPPEWLHPRMEWFFAPRRHPWRHKRFTQCFSLIPPFPSAPVGQPSPFDVYNWHPTGNFLYLRWDGTDWCSYDYTGERIPKDSKGFSLPPPDILKEKMGRFAVDSALPVFLHRPEMAEVLLFWWQPEEPRFSLILFAYARHLSSLCFNYSSPYIPWEFWLSPLDPRPILRGRLRMLVWRKGKLRAEKDLGRFPIQYLFPAIEKRTGVVYLPLMMDMGDDGEGKFRLFVFQRNDWTPEIYDLK